VLLKHTRLSDYVKVDAEHAIFTFDFSDYENEWRHFIAGKYSKIDDSVKRKILNYFEKHSGNHVYVESYLYPEKYVAKYAELLNVPVELLISVGELCDKPNLEKEKLRKALGWENRFVLIYVGAHGLANNLNQIIEVAHLQNYFMHNLPALSDFYQTKKEDQIIDFLNNLVFSSIHN
jgi:hypothetical protein